MTIELTEQSVYIGVVIILMAIQIWQHYKITKLETQTFQIWNQISILVASISSKLLDLDKKIDDRVGKSAKD
jgi:hypothetical protein